MAVTNSWQPPGHCAMSFVIALQPPDNLLALTRPTMHHSRTHFYYYYQLNCLSLLPSTKMGNFTLSSSIHLASFWKQKRQSQYGRYTTTYYFGLHILIWNLLFTLLIRWNFHFVLFRVIYLLLAVEFEVNVWNHLKLVWNHRPS